MKDRIDDVEDRLEISEFIIRAFMAVGILIWTFAAMGALLGGHMPVFYLYGTVAIFAAIAFVVGEFHELVGSALLAAGAAGLVVWGVVSGWELAIWVMMGAMLILPTLAAAGMFLVEEHEEKVIERVEETRPIHVVHA